MHDLVKEMDKRLQQRNVMEAWNYFERKYRYYQSL